MEPLEWIYRLPAAASLLTWFSPITGRTTSGGTVSAGIPILFTSPIAGDAVLYLQAMPALSSQNSDTSTSLSSSDTVLTAAATSTQTSGLSLSNTGPVTVTQGASVTTTISASSTMSRKRSIISFLYLDFRREFLLLFPQAPAPRTAQHN